jgi:hypothetical protein
MRVVSLRAEDDGRDSRSLTARLDEGGALVIEGHDLGPGVAPVSSDGEYEWRHTIHAEHVPELMTLLEAPADADILDTLERRWSGRRSYELERRLRDASFPVETWTWSG